MPTDSADPHDIPYGDDWHSVAGVTAWVDAADRKRPWRAQFRDFIAEQIAGLPPQASVIELGSGPGLVAERVLQRCSHLGSYTLFDFSQPMLDISRERLAQFLAASFVHGSFKADDWIETFTAPFDCILSVQAVHELRHKRHVPRLYQQLFQIAATPGLVLICDHTPWDDSNWSTSLFMTEQEQIDAFAAAGFRDVEVALSINGLVLYRCRKAP